jgi:UDP-N-acetyl-D-glucosamine dehydrogenase
LRVHDPYVNHWWEFERQDEYPSPAHGLKRFFRNQDKLADLRIESDLQEALRGADAVIFAVRHQPYLNLDPDEVVETAGGSLAVIDCFGILPDAKIKRYFELGCEVKGLGRGHVKRIKDQVRDEKEQMLLQIGSTNRQ